MSELIMILNHSYCYSSAIIFIIAVLNLVHVKRSDRGRALSMHALLSIFFLTILTPLVVSLLWLCWCAQQLIGIFLRVTYGNRFVGFFTNFDAMHARSVVGKSTLNVLLMAECDANISGEDVLNSVSKTINNKIISKEKKNRKLSSTLRHCLGYRFLLERDDIDVVDCVRKMKEMPATKSMTKSDLLETLELYTKQPFPFDNEFLWDVHVGVRPVIWKATQDKKYYPILFRFHHCVADGVNVFNFITGVCGYKTCKVNGLVSTKEKPNDCLVRIYKTITEMILSCILFPAILYTCLVTCNNNLHLNMPHIRKRGGSVVVSVDELKVYFNKVIRISKSCEVSFTSVLAAAYSASICDYYVSRYDSAPEYLTTLIPLQSQSLSLQTLEPGSKTINEISFYNEYQLSFMHLPIDPQDVPLYNRLSMIDRLGLVMNNITREQKKKYFRGAVNQLLKIVFTVVPSPALRLITYPMEYGPIISNIPGTSKICFGEEILPISDYIFYVPDAKRFSFALMITSYDSRLQLALATSLEMKQKELQKMLSNIYKYIDQLENEIDNTSLSGSKTSL